MSTRAIVLAAGKGTRMKSERAKVLHEIAGKPLIGWALEILSGLDLAQVVVVVGHQADAVAATLPEGVDTALQEHQLGTGHAADFGLRALDVDEGDTVLVLPGDMPLLRSETIQSLLVLHEARGAAATLLTSGVDSPAGLGRIVRHGGEVVGIVEERDATPEQREISEVNMSVYAFSAGVLADLLGRLGTDNAQGEYYLTDVVGLAVAGGLPVAALQTDSLEALGVNSHDQLAAAAAVLRGRINARWMRDGVAMVDPDRVYIDAGVELSAGAVIYPEVHLSGATTVGEGTRIGPSVWAADALIGAGCVVWYSVLRGATLGDDVEVGPYASLRPGTVLGRGSRAGSFVEIKNSEVGAGSRVPHLSYVGDATIGEDSNIGAAAVTVNYDGRSKHRTVIGDRVLIGSDTMLIAPVSVGDDAQTGAGSVITRDVPPGALAVERSHQREIPGYAARRKRGATEEQD